MKTENKFYSTNYELISPYLKSDFPNKDEKLNILVASDIHYQESVSRDLFTTLVKYAKEVMPDIIVMPGDLIETIDFIDNTDSKDFFEKIIRDLSEIAPVVIIPGNHEIKNFSKENFHKRLESSNDDINYKALKYFDSLNKFKNVYFLNNEQTMIKGTTFFGFNPRLSSYLKKDDKQVADEFIEDYIKSGFKMAEDDYNILLTHSPIQVVNKDVFNTINDFSKLTDLVITGHLHDGYLPKILDKPLGNTNAGLFFTPLVAPYPGMLCRGVHDFGRGYIFISQGYRKWTADVFITNFFEKFTANDVERLIIKKGEEKQIENVTEEKPYVKKNQL